jgi:hypothetical protein
MNTKGIIKQDDLCFLAQSDVAHDFSVDILKNYGRRLIPCISSNYNSDESKVFETLTAINYDDMIKKALNNTLNINNKTINNTIYNISSIYTNHIIGTSIDGLELLNLIVFDKSIKYY